MATKILKINGLGLVLGVNKALYAIVIKGIWNKPFTTLIAFVDFANTINSTNFRVLLTASTRTPCQRDEITIPSMHVRMAVSGCLLTNHVCEWSVACRNLGHFQEKTFTACASTFANELINIFRNPSIGTAVKYDVWTEMYNPFYVRLTSYCWHWFVKFYDIWKYKYVYEGQWFNKNNVYRVYRVYITLARLK